MCHPEKGEDVHQFTPPLVRDHVHVGSDSCVDCEELRGAHRGDREIARRYSWSERDVVEALEDLAAGKSYASVSRSVREKNRAGFSGGFDSTVSLATMMGPPGCQEHGTTSAC